MDTIGIVGAGLIGRAWAIVFARSGHPVKLWDGEAKQREAALPIVGGRLRDLEAAGLIGDPAAVLKRIAVVGTMAEAVRGVSYVQECLPEILELKRKTFAEMDALAAPETILASSTSTMPASSFTETLKGRARCLVAHPVNPPYLVPVVELSGAPWTSPPTLARARQLQEAAGQKPVTVQREIAGFILNRLQGALLNEAFRLVEDGYVTPEDLDTTIAHGLGLRWSFMGPFETIDLNAPDGLADYCRRYGPVYYTMAKEQADPRSWEAVTPVLEANRRRHLPAARLGERQAWRDRRLMALAAHKIAMDEREGT
ncbi:MAG: 3-hydroxyacyl-CoA dehydrogenase [Alphaproteobacteria bacterium]|nr:3-hydroxyacyl-CoA dehydrogenase [Alphaproteobacteria bacterium]